MAPRAKEIPPPYVPPMLATAAQFRCQPAVVQLLDRTLRLGRVRGALLIQGERGLGKTTLAAMLARAITCEKNRDGELHPKGLWFCGECYACRSIASGNQHEFTAIRPRRKLIGVEQIREDYGDLDQAALHPISLSHRVFLFDEAHLLSLELGNRWLKLLEEPPERSVFMLVTDKPQLLLPTIRSRGQRIALSPNAPQELTRVLIDELPGNPEAELREAAVMSAGRYVQAKALALDREWRRAVKALAEAMRRSSGTDRAAAALIANESSLLPLGEDDVDEGKDAGKRSREMERTALISAYQRAAWWLTCVGQARPGLLLAITRLRIRVDQNCDLNLVQAAFEAELALPPTALGMSALRALAV